MASTGDTSLDHSAKEGTGVFDVANLLLRFLPTKDGVVMRRLLMSAVSILKLESFFFYPDFLNANDSHSLLACCWVLQVSTHCVYMHYYMLALNVFVSVSK